MEEEELDESVVGSFAEEALDDSGIDPSEDNEGYQDDEFVEPAPSKGVNEGDDDYAAEFEEQKQETASTATPVLPRLHVPNNEADGAGSIRSRAMSSAQASSTSISSATEDLNKRYLALLNSGRLASKKKTELSEAASLRAAGSRGMTPLSEVLSGARSVHEADLTRLMTSASLEVSPVARAFRPPTDLTIRTSQSFETNASPQRGSTGSSQFRVALLAASAPTTPSARKLLTPGPGAYEAVIDRSSAAGPFKFSFGTSQQRPSQVLPDSMVFPGPVYNPHKEATSALSNPARIAFSRQDVGSRFSLGANVPSNAPQWNPGPGNYAARTTPNGGKVEPGADAPKVVFGKSQKLLSPERSLSGSAFISEGHAKRENMSLHSPGPGVYNPNDLITHHSASRYSLAAKGASYFDGLLDPSKQPSPGPIYSHSSIDNRGNKTWGDDPKATFGRSKKQFEPEVNFSSSAFISKDHALHCNLSLHSPGPVYLPEMPQAHTRVPHLSSGPTDRFYDRFEPGRIA